MQKLAIQALQHKYQAEMADAEEKEPTLFDSVD